MTISEEIKTIEFEGLRGFDCSKIVCFLSEGDRWYHHIPFWHELRILIMGLFGDDKKYVVKKSKGQPRNLFAFNEPYNQKRFDMYDMLCGAYECAPNATFIEMVKCIRVRGWREICTLFTLYYKWWVQLSEKTSLNVKQKTAVVCTLMKGWSACKRLEDYCYFQNIVVCYDANFQDNVPAQMFRIKGGKAVTLQHGLMCATRDLPYSGICFRAFVSDYFLAWNELTKSEAIKDGIPADRIKVCGIAKCLNASPIQPIKNKIIGVLLDGHHFINKGMIQVANEFCQKHGYKYVLRYHPSYEWNEYDDIIDPQRCIGVCKDSLYDYAQQVEFTLQGNSAALMELLYMEHPTYVYSTGSVFEVYERYIPVIKSEKELEELILSKSYLEEAYSKLISVKNIRQVYADFFSTL